MFIKMTDRYKGRFPVDLGGLVLAGYGQREIPDELGARLLTFNFPLAAACDANGKLLQELPPLPEVKEESAPAIPNEDPDTAPPPAEEIVGVVEAPVIEPVNEEGPKAKRGRRG